MNKALKKKGKDTATLVVEWLPGQDIGMRDYQDFGNLWQN